MHKCYCLLYLPATYKHKIPTARIIDLVYAIQTASAIAKMRSACTQVTGGSRILGGGCLTL